MFGSALNSYYKYAVHQCRGGGVPTSGPESGAGVFGDVRTDFLRSFKASTTFRFFRSYSKWTYVRGLAY